MNETQDAIIPEMTLGYDSTDPYSASPENRKSFAGPKPSALTQGNLAKHENKARRSTIQSSLINAAMTDVQRVNKVKSEYNSGGGNQMKAGQMFQCMSLAKRMGGPTSGVGNMFMPTIDEDGTGSLLSGTSGTNPFGSMSMFGGKAYSTFNPGNQF